METPRKSRISVTGALKRVGLLSKTSQKTNKELVESSANLSKVTATAGVLTATGFITQASFAAITVAIGSATIGVTAGTIVPVIGALVFVSGFLAERLSVRDNLRVTMILVHKESKRMKHIIDIIEKDTENNKHISFDVYNAMLYELNAFIMSMMTSEQLSGLGINNQKGISSFNRYFSTVVNPGSFMNIILERLSRTTSAFVIIVAEYTINKHGKWEAPQNKGDNNSSTEQKGGDAEALEILQKIGASVAREAEGVQASASGAEELQNASEYAGKELQSIPEESQPVQNAGSYTRKGKGYKRL
jgi:hypothetical protein